MQTSGDEIIYHIFLRSFYDSNDDAQGDLNGLKQKLDYLQKLGVTSVLLTPLYRSVYYHNYFADDFELIDPSFGTPQEYFDLVNDIHERGMKLYMDMEIQYITEDHLWYKDSYKNPSSLYSDYIIYRDKENKDPETIIFNINGLNGYNGVYKRITTVNLHNKKLQEYIFNLFSFWIDPAGDGSYKQGIDGFRLDHMMDTLDNKEKLGNLFASFWQPLINKLKLVNPAVIFIAEQTDWSSFGLDHIKTAGVDRVFAFPLREAIISFDKTRIVQAAEITFSAATRQEQNIVFIENHDIHRFASLVFNDSRKIRIGAALNLLIGGTPAIYYGQELGMKGEGGFGKYGVSDGNDIPRREAFKWYKEIEGKGMALWYRDTGPWWDDTQLKAGDGVSLEEQQGDPDSVWNFYRQLIMLRKMHTALMRGSYYTLKNNSTNVYSFLRSTEEESIMVVINLADKYETVIINLESHLFKDKKADLPCLFGEIAAEISFDKVKINLSSYNIGVWKLSKDV